MEQVSNFLLSFDSTRKTDSHDAVSISSDHSLGSSDAQSPNKKRPSAGIDLTNIWGSVKKSTQDAIGKADVGPEDVRSKPESRSQTSKDSYFSSSSSTSSHLTDKLFERIIAMALPTPSSVSQESIEERIEAQRSRPSLSVPLMSKNFILMNARLSGVFVLIDELIKVLSWRYPTYTLGLLSIYTWLVLNPVLLLSVPLLYVLFCVLVPNYLVMHQPEALIGMVNPVPTDGPSLRKPELPTPAPETSREFFLNVTDLQNHMLLYVTGYDFVNGLSNHLLYFRDEALTSCVFVCLLCAVAFNVCLLPWIVRRCSSFIVFVVQWGLIVGGWSFAALCHPKYWERVIEYYYTEDTRLRILTLANQLESHIIAEFWSEAEPAEEREVEVYELQHCNDKSKQWQSFGYTTDAYTNRAVSRSGKQIPTTLSSLSKVQAPQRWEFSGASWKLDLSPEGWVQRNVLWPNVIIDQDEKWVYDSGEAGARGSYRRRRWSRVCTRVLVKEAPAGDLEEERVKPKRTVSSSYSDYLLPKEKLCRNNLAALIKSREWSKSQRFRSLPLRKRK